jgi:hypothetical protein
MAVGFAPEAGQVSRSLMSARPVLVSRVSTASLVRIRYFSRAWYLRRGWTLSGQAPSG